MHLLYLQFPTANLPVFTFFHHLLMCCIVGSSALEGSAVMLPDEVLVDVTL